MSTLGLRRRQNVYQTFEYTNSSLFDEGTSECNNNYQTLDNLNQDNKLNSIRCVSSLKTKISQTWETLFENFVDFLLTNIPQLRSKEPQPSKQALDVLDYLKHTASIPYDTSNIEHESILQDTWNLLMPYTPLPDRITSMWGAIGFQGRDPATDFRGTGELGLRVLHHFAKQHNFEAKRILRQSHELLPVDAVYPFACAIINLTDTLLKLAVAHPGTIGELLTFSGASNFQTLDEALFYSCDKTFLFGEMLSCIFIQFHEYYISQKPQNILAFNSICSQFFSQVASVAYSSKTFYKSYVE